jgi:hypothetical protein
VIGDNTLTAGSPNARVLGLDKANVWSGEDAAVREAVHDVGRLFKSAAKANGTCSFFGHFGRWVKPERVRQAFEGADVGDAR